MVQEGLAKDICVRTNIASNYYDAKIEAAIKDNPRIKNVRLKGFPEALRYPKMIRLVYNHCRDIDFSYIDISGKNDKEESSLILENNR